MSLLPCIQKSKVPLKPHQIRVVNHMAVNRGIIVVHPTGSGKGLLTVASVMCNANQDKVFIVTPKSLQANFQSQMKAYGVRVSDPRFEFYTLDKFAKACEDDPQLVANAFVVIDEAHNLKTAIVDEDDNQGKRKGIRAKSIITALQSAEKVMLLTATALMNDPSDLNNLLAMVQGREPFVTKKVLAPERFKCWISILKDNRREGYPKVEHHTISFRMSQEFYHDYHAIEKKSEEDMMQARKQYGEGDLQAYMNGIRRACNNLRPANPKVQWVKEKLLEDALFTGEKSLVYSAFLNSGMDEIRHFLKKQKIPFQAIDGQLSGEERARIVKKYNEDKIQVLLISRAGSEGLDLKGTMNEILLEPSWNEAQEEQVIGRGVRLNSHAHLPEASRVVRVYRLLLKKPISVHRFDDDRTESADEVLSDIMKRKSLRIKEYMKELEKYSIEEAACQSYEPPVQKPITTPRIRKIPLKKQFQTIPATRQRSDTSTTSSTNY